MKLILKTYDWAGLIYKEFTGKSKKNCLNQLNRYLEATVGCPEHFNKDIRWEK